MRKYSFVDKTEPYQKLNSSAQTNNKKQPRLLQQQSTQNTATDQILKKRNRAQEVSKKGKYQGKFI